MSSLAPALIGLAGVPLGVAGTLGVQSITRRWAKADAASSRRAAAKEASQRAAAERMTDMIVLATTPDAPRDGAVLLDGGPRGEEIRQALVDGWIAPLRPLRAAAALLPDPWFGRIDTLAVCLMHSFLFADAATVVYQLKKDLRAFLEGHQEPTEIAPELLPTYSLMSTAMAYKISCREGRFDIKLPESRRQLTSVFAQLPEALREEWMVIAEPVGPPARILPGDEDFLFQAERVLTYRRLSVAEKSQTESSQAG